MEPIQLSLEQEFLLKSRAMDFQQLSREQAIAMLIQIDRLILTQEAVYKQLLAKEWGIVP